MAVDCKSDSRQGGPKFLQISKGRKSETVEIKIKRSNIQSIQHDRMCHAYCLG